MLCSLLENIRVKRAGYAFRQKYAVFLHRYKMLCEDTWPHYNGTTQPHTILSHRYEMLCEDA